MKHWLVYLYPRAWRQRYGDEFCAVLAQQHLTIADVVDIMRGALDAHWTRVRALPQAVVMQGVRASVLLLVVLLSLYIFPSLLVSPVWGAGQWRFVARPPLPPHARHRQIDYLRGPDYDDVLNRVTTFDTDQPVVAIQQFYRAALPRRGWHYLCTATATEPSCGRISAGDSDADVRDVYDPSANGTRHGHAIEIVVLPLAADGTRTVRVREVVLSESTRVPTSADPTGPPPVALVGVWRGTDSAAGKNFIMRVYQDNRIEVTGTSSATYQWDGDTTIRITFTSSLLNRGIGEGGDGAYRLCANAPAFLKDQCQPSVADPAAYPAPVAPAPPTPEPITTVTPEPAYPGPPAPTPQSQIDATFTVAVDGDTLTLTNPSGMTQTFQRVDGT